MERCKVKCDRPNCGSMAQQRRQSALVVITALHMHAAGDAIKETLLGVPRACLPASNSSARAAWQFGHTHSLLVCKGGDERQHIRYDAVELLVRCAMVDGHVLLQGLRKGKLVLALAQHVHVEQLADLWSERLRW